MSDPSGTWPGDYGARSNQALRRALAVSAAAHLLFAVLVIFWPAWRAPRIDPSQAFMVSLVAEPGGGKAAPKPKEVAAPPEPAAPEAPALPEEPEAEEKVVSEVKEPEKKAAEKEPEHKCPVLKADRQLAQAIDNIRARMRREAELQAAIAQLKRNNAGAAAEGGGTGEVVGEGFAGGVLLSFNLYYQEVWERVRRNWVLPTLRQQKLAAVVAVRIARDGAVESVELEASSGDSAFDRSALNAVRASNPLPPLPGDYLGRWHEVGIRFHQ